MFVSFHKVLADNHHPFGDRPDDGTIVVVSNGERVDERAPSAHGRQLKQAALGRRPVLRLSRARRSGTAASSSYAKQAVVECPVGLPAGQGISDPSLEPLWCGCRSADFWQRFRGEFKRSFDRLASIRGWNPRGSSPRYWGSSRLFSGVNRFLSLRVLIALPRVPRKRLGR